jgi:hypothetical protein
MPCLPQQHVAGDVLGGFAAAGSILTVVAAMLLQAEDFNWLRSQQSPNWRIIPADERALPVPPSRSPSLLPLAHSLPAQNRHFNFACN